MRTKIQLTGIYLFLLCTLISCSGKNNLTPIDTSVDKGIYTHELINNKENCELPCFWGIEIGETTYDEIYPYFSSFATKVLELSKVNDDSYTGGANFYDSIEDTEFFVGYNMVENVIRIISSSVIYEDHTYLSISEIMQTYGVPTEVYLGARVNSMLTWDTSITIFYENINTRFQFFAGEQPEFENGNVDACFLGSPAITIWNAELWNKEHKIGFHDLFPYIEEEVSYEEQKNVRLLEEVTDWTVEDFYLHFYNNNEFCVEIINR